MNAVLSLLLVALAVQTHAEEKDFKCPLPRGSYRHSEDCNALYVCEDNVAELKYCAPGLNYNRLTENCDWPEASQCIKGPITDSDLYEVAFNPIDDSDLYEGSDIKCPPTDCNCNIPGPSCSPVYYKCIGRKPHIKKCSTGLVFDPKTLLCSFPKNVEECLSPNTTIDTPTTNESITTTTKSTPTTTKSTPTTTKSTPTTTKSTPTTTKSTLTTTKSTPTTTKSTPTTTESTTTTNKSTPTTTKSTPTTTKATTITPSGVCTNFGTGPDPHPTNCSRFCLGGEEMDCPRPLHYHHPSRRCEWPCIALCDPNEKPCPTNSTPTDQTSKPTLRPSVCTNWGTGPDPHPTDCAKFCLGGEEMDCPKPLHYDHSRKRCEWPCIARCDSSVKPCNDSNSTTKPPSTSVPRVCTNWGTGPDPHPTDCAKFCLGGEEMDCPKPLHYDHSRKRCEWPCIARCDSSVKPCNDSNSTTKPPTTSVPSVCTNWGTGPDPHPTDCAKFCLGGEEMDCPKPLHYDHSRKRCEWPCIARCDSSVKPCNDSNSTTKPPTTSVPSVCTNWGTGPDPHPTDCAKFCLGGEEMDCPKPLHYDHSRKRCEWPCIARCDSSVKPCNDSNSTTKPPTTSVPSVCTNWGTGPDPHPTDCAKFCLGGEEMDCPKPLHYDHSRKRCEWPCIARCDPKVPPCNTTETTTPSTNSTPTISPCGKDGLYPHPDCCDKYIHCTNGVAVIKECGKGLLFNPETETCDWPENVDCSQTSTTPPPPIDHPIGNCSCECCMIPDTCDCNKFLLCEEKKLYIKSCAEGLVFNPATENCDFSWNVLNPVCKKGQAISYGKSALYTQIHHPDAPICQLEFGLFPDKTNCGRFYHCVNWRPHSKLCPDGLHWNAIAVTCDSPCYAKCDERVQC